MAGSNIEYPVAESIHTAGIFCVILVAGHSDKLESDLQKCELAQHANLRGKPKALLPAVGEKCILDYWWDVTKTRKLFKEVYLVTNADKYKHYERWASATDFPLKNIINDGSTMASNSLGALRDFELVLDLKNLRNENVMVIAGDMLFQDSKFDMAQVVDYFWQNDDGSLAIYYEMHPKEDTNTRGIVDVHPSNNKILSFMEKPDTHQTKSRFASVVFYALRQNALQLLSSFKQDSVQTRTFGSFIQWLVNEKQVTFYGMKLPTGFQLIGDVGLHEYNSWLNYFKQKSQSVNCGSTIYKKVYARIGLLGNPSDGFNGKTISLSIENFWAEVWVVESESLRLVPHPLNDPTEFGSLADLYCVSSKEGYLGGLRLLQATCKKFYQYCSKKGIALSKRNFTMSYDTNVPRQVGLAGSSAIITAALRCLLAFYNLTESDMPKHTQPQFILDVEKQELMINAGLQDRVVQVYEGLVYMDFNKSVMDQQGYGNYTYINASKLPNLFLAYENNPSDSGRIHSNVAARFSVGDKTVIDGMQAIGNLAEQGLEALETGSWHRLAELMKENFEHRLQMYGEAALGKKNLEMIQIGTEFGASVKFPGSGGAVIGILPDELLKEQMKRKYRDIGCVFVDIVPVVNSLSKN